MFQINYFLLIFYINKINQNQNIWTVDQSIVQQMILWIPICLALHVYEQYPTASQLHIHFSEFTIVLQFEHIFSFDLSKK